MSEGFTTTPIKVGILAKSRAVMRLTRWREHVPYTVPLVVCGAMLAVHLDGGQLTWQLLPVVLANILAMAFAFMINDIEDAPDDAHSPWKKERNVVSAGLLTNTEAGVITGLVFVLSLTLYAFGGWKTFGAGGLTLVLSYLYSAHPFRLKARPVVDILSHVLMLSGLLIFSGYLIYATFPSVAWLPIIAVTLISMYGQLYNQLDDFDVDQHAGLHNTAIILGKRNAKILLFVTLGTAILCIVLAAILGAFPSYLGPIGLIIVFTLAMFDWNTDMRGNQTDVSGMSQKPSLIAFNILMLVWLVGELGMLAALAPQI
jgi:4-hydroxybenzoate polyprenyltransferase